MTDYVARSELACVHVRRDGSVRRIPQVAARRAAGTFWRLNTDNGDDQQFFRHRCRRRVIPRSLWRCWRRPPRQPGWRRPTYIGRAHDRGPYPKQSRRRRWR